MEIVYFILIIVGLYFVFTQIKFTHISKLPVKKQHEALKRKHVRSMLLHNHLKEDPAENKQIDTFKTLSTDKILRMSDEFSSKQKNSNDYTNNYWDGGKIPRPSIKNGILDSEGLPNASNLLYLIKSEYMDDQYRFNISNQPVTSRSSNQTTISLDNKYLFYINKDIDAWNILFSKYYDINKKLIHTMSLKTLFIQETQHEFIIKLYASLLYLGKSLHFQLVYYGNIEQNDEFLNNVSDKYILQLADISPIAKSQFEARVDPINLQDDGPFMSMKDQIKYVDRIHKLHQEELE